jgi:hypothetical protein
MPRYGMKIALVTDTPYSLLLLDGPGQDAFLADAWNMCQQRYMAPLTNINQHVGIDGVSYLFNAPDRYPSINGPADQHWRGYGLTLTELLCKGKKPITTQGLLSLW